MKNSKEYSAKLQKEYKSLKKANPKVKPVYHDSLLQALVHGAVSEKVTEDETRKAIKNFDDYFVDYNDLRVSRTEEITEKFSKETDAVKSIAKKLTAVLMSVFEKYNTLQINEIADEGIRQARQELENIPYITPYMVDYCMLTFIQGHAIPLTEAMIEYLKENELVHPDSDYNDIEGFLLRQINSSNGYEFYKYLRKAAEQKKPSEKKKTSGKSAKKAKKKKASKAGKSAKKTAKKTTKKTAKKTTKKTSAKSSKKASKSTKKKTSKKKSSKKKK